MAERREESPLREQGYIAQKMEILSATAALVWRRMKSAVTRRTASREQESAVPAQVEDPQLLHEHKEAIVDPLASRDAYAIVPQQERRPSLVQAASSGVHSTLEKIHQDAEAVSEATKDEIDAWRHHGRPGSPYFASHVVGQHPAPAEEQKKQKGVLEKMAQNARKTLERMKNKGPSEVPDDFEELRESHHRGVAPPSIASHLFMPRRHS